MAGYVALTVAFYWTTVRDINTRLMSEGVDGAVFLWNYWALPQAIWEQQDPFQTSLIYHPVGAPLAFHAITPLETFMIWGVSLLLGTVLAVNLVMLASLAFSAFTGYLIALHECGSRRAAFLAGLAFGFVPAHVWRPLAHHNLTHTWVVGLGLLAFLRLYDRPTRWRSLAFGVTLAMAFLTDVTLAFFLVVAASVVGIWRWRTTLTRVFLVLLLQALAVAILISSPLLIGMVKTIRAGHLDPAPPFRVSDTLSADLLSWVTPSALHPWWGDHFAHLNATVTGGERLAYPGLLLLALAVVGAVIAARRGRAVWIAMLLTFFVLSLGPFLKVNGDAVGNHFEHLGERFSVPLPFWVLRSLPVVSGLRVPGRFSMMAALTIGVLAALAITRLSQGRRRLAWVLPAVAIAVTLVEFMSVRPHNQPAAVPTAYKAIATSPHQGAVLEIPLQWRDGFGITGDSAAGRDNTIFLYYATTHHRPVVNGFIARYPRERLARLKSIPVYRQVLALEGEPGFADPPTFGIADLRALGIDFVVYHRDRPVPAAYRYLESLAMPVLADDGTVLVWGAR